ncbi:MAG: hypothetical protein WC862_00135 [Patescibacteria group bacterium]
MKIEEHLVARSPRRSLSRTAMRERVSLRRKPCPPALFQLRRVNISELNQRGGQIQIQFFGKANGGSFQFFPSMILFHKNRWIKPSLAGFHDCFSYGIQQVFRRGDGIISIILK